LGIWEWHRFAILSVIMSAIAPTWFRHPSAIPTLLGAKLPGCALALRILDHPLALALKTGIHVDLSGAIYLHSAPPSENHRHVVPVDLSDNAL
jgi:hypothetical protein